MAVAKKKTWKLLFAFALIAALFMPQMALAYEKAGDPENPKLTIYKYEQEKGTAPGEEGTGLPGQKADGTPVAGVEYTLKQTHSYNPETDKWTPVTEGAPIVKTTDANGIAVFSKEDGLQLGRYEVAETDGPGHILLNTEPFYVDVPMTNKEGTTLNYDVHVYPKNETIRSDVELTKIAEDEKPLAGVTFKLYNADGTAAIDREGNEIPAMTTGDLGKINVSGLAAGKYYFQEKNVPEGYALNNTKIEFEVKKTGEKGQDIVVAWTYKDGFVNDNGTVTNYFNPEIIKDAEGESNLIVDRDKLFEYNLTIKAPKDINKYKSIAVTDNLDSRLEYGGSWDVAGTGKDNIEFTQDGQLLKWTVKDPSKLTPGQDIKITFSAKIKPDAELKEGETGIPNTADLEFNNDRGWEKVEKPKDPPVVVPTNGGLKVIKVDASNNKFKLKGAEFKLTDLDGNPIDTSRMGNVVKVNDVVHNGLLENLATPKDGTIVITGLTPGTYQLHETKAPTYKDREGNTKSYRLLTKPIEVTVANNETATYEVENSKSGWVLPTTGGLGTVLFTSGGLALMVMAAGMYVRRRKTDSDMV
ncbi:SpaA isopeptide-forming pilin-related protein [Edaphobacillus lindanitolerans]|uniref:LPXTG-motif cell wall anchor domain-containing protein/fimbrial isopeptide formation D2 domain-containing protein n=1 Tax=Edaphobacillus lindanitolerans TaxID=550447 RepID=A0A1U7PL58_9BACI|nr:SpaA isopeptide-forming pilin-related protein [Edaphobacillus lindanitolerans]SIT73947.1 LPXTG-motif cell wall anchor domain-containing protein/fimbrial isopeptide formation D2 domain-containing protein [Edaphobacillus lindanitolerans]